MAIKPIERVLVANRGEIACRVFRTAKRLGITSVAVYSDADKNSLHTQLGDYSYNIGPAAPRKSYLNKLKIIDTALKLGAQAIHPGYCFYQKMMTLPIL